MAPHHRRLTMVRHYRISNDALISILEYLDPPSLFNASKAFRRIYDLVMVYQNLRYKFELALAGMKDGPVPSSLVAPHVRLQLLAAYRKAWPALEWTHESKMQIILPAMSGFSGGFIHQIRNHGVFTTLDLTEIPSCRTNRPPDMIRQLRYNTSSIEGVGVDGAQGLVVTSHIFDYNGQVGLRLQFRDLWTFEKHHRASGSTFECTTQMALRVSRMAILVCGSKVGIAMEFEGGHMKHLIINWRTFDARWFDELDVCFLHDRALLTLHRKSGLLMLALYDISHVSRPGTIREYELPPTWNHSVVGFADNSSPATDYASSPDALFYASPESRVVGLNIKSIPGSQTPNNWLFIKESYFRYPSRRDAVRVPWEKWAQFCVIRDIGSAKVCGPHLLGNRVMFVETSQRSSKSSARIHLIEFTAFPEPSVPMPRAWSWQGSYSGLIPTETYRSIPHSTLNGLAVDDFRITEDNVVLFTDANQGSRWANILTFGAPIVRPARR